MIVHMFQYGTTACLREGFPSDWPEGERWSSEWKNVTCEECLKGKDAVIETYVIASDGKSITCKRCGMTSYNLHDVEERWCGRCKVFHEDLWPPARRAWIESGLAEQGTIFIKRCGQEWLIQVSIDAGVGIDRIVHQDRNLALAMERVFAQLYARVTARISKCESLRDNSQKV